MRSLRTTSIGALPVILILGGLLLASCNGSPPVIGEPKIVEPPAPVAPGAEVSVRIDVTSSKPVAYQWKTIEDCGKIIGGETSSAAIWQAPQQPSLCNIYVEVTIDNVITEKSIVIKVAGEVDTSIAASTHPPAEILAADATSTATIAGVLAAQTVSVPTAADTSTATNTATPSPTVPTATPRPTATPTPTRPPTPTPIPPLKPDLALEAAIRSAQADPQASFAVVALQAATSRRPTFEDDFSSLTTGFEKIDTGESLARYEDGVYLMATHPDSPCCIGPNTRGNYTDVVAQLDMRLDAFERSVPNWGSFTLRRTPNVGYYIFDLMYDGTSLVYQVGYEKGNTSIRLRQGYLPASSSSVAGTWHNMIIVMMGNQIAYFVDGILVTAFTDNPLTQGGFDMFAGWGTAVRVDNLRLWDMSDLSPTD